MADDITPLSAPQAPSASGGESSQASTERLLSETPGAEGVHDSEGTLIYVRMPPEHTGTDLHPRQVPDYQPKFERQSGHRRVLQAITDEIDSEVYGPRNTIPALAVQFAHDPYTPQINLPSVTELRVHHPGQDITFGGDQSAETQVEAFLNDLVSAGLVELRDGSYALTEAGLVELHN